MGSGPREATCRPRIPIGRTCAGSAKRPEAWSATSASSPHEPHSPWTTCTISWRRSYFSVRSGAVRPWFAAVASPLEGTAFQPARPRLITSRVLNWRARV